jgi:hypothetical protein
MARVGENVKLPSGIVVRITCAADPARPWGAVHLGRHWCVLREFEKGYGVQHYFGGRSVPYQLAEADALALAEALNRA